MNPVHFDHRWHLWVFAVDPVFGPHLGTESSWHLLAIYPATILDNWGVSSPVEAFAAISLFLSSWTLRL